jgi:SAM-dependent methyltransferase
VLVVGDVLNCSAVHDPDRRRRLGAWYTPDEVVHHLVAAALSDATPRTVLDPACGDGRFLAAVRDAVAARGGCVEVCGMDIDPEALGAARQRLGPHAELVHADALAHPWQRRRFDLVIGNPPFLSPLVAGNSTHRPAGAQYADAAVAFWRLAHDLAEPHGGRVAFVMPVSVLASRDAGPTRAHIAAKAAWRWWWWAERPVFPDAQVITGAVVTELGGATVDVTRQMGPHFAAAPPVAPPVPPTDSWGWLVADSLGLPPWPGDHLVTADTLARYATARGDFRDQYYGMVGSVVDDGDGPPLITSGLIDPGRCHWGERPVRFAGERFARPAVEVARLSPTLQAWVQRRLVPKVLVASQTRIIEAVADPDGRWLPGVPVISVVPHEPADVAPVACVLTSPVASLWLAHRAAGTGRSARVVRVSAPVLNDVPWPAGNLDDAVVALSNGDVQGCAAATLDAYRLGELEAAVLLDWWRSALPRGAR